jgi:hypothetical protein
MIWLLSIPSLASLGLAIYLWNQLRLLDGELERHVVALRNHKRDLLALFAEIDELHAGTQPAPKAMSLKK